MRESANIWILRSRQTVAQLVGWGAWLGVLFIANNRYEWGNPRACCLVFVRGHMRLASKPVGMINMFSYLEMGVREIRSRVQCRVNV